MKVLVAVVFLIMVVSLWNFSLPRAAEKLGTSMAMMKSKKLQQAAGASPLHNDGSLEVGYDGVLRECRYATDCPPRRPFEYQIVDTPEEIMAYIDKIIELERPKNITERKLEGVIDGGSVNLFSFDGYPNVKHRIKEILLPIAEELSGEKLESTALYGVREYTHGATLYMHLDRRETHVYSFTITHDKDVDWPLRYTDSDGEYVDVEIEPGQMLFYIGADYEHGRPTAFEGESYINYYCHYKPVDVPVTVASRRLSV